MSDLRDWYKKMNGQDEEPTVVVKPIGSTDTLQTTNPREEMFNKINNLFAAKDQSGNNTDNFTEKNVSVNMPNGTTQDIVVQRQEVKNDLPIVINPTSDAEKIQQNDRLDRDTVDPKPQEYVEKRDDVLVAKLIAINTSAGYLIQRLSLYSNYLTQPMEHLERKKILEQLVKIQTTYGSILAELNMV